MIAGAALLALLIAQTGATAILDQLGDAGFGLLWVTLFHPLHLPFMAWAWALAFPAPDGRPGAGALVFASWLGQSVNTLLPVATIGGELVKARLAIHAGAPAPLAAASVVIDKTTQALATLALMLIGLGVLALEPSGGALFWAVAATCLVLGGGIAGFVALQRSRALSGRLTRFASLRDGKRWASVESWSAALGAHLRAGWAQPGRIAAATAIRVVSAVALAVEVYVAAWLMGIDLSLADAAALRLLGFALRSAAFFVWGGLGVQEGAYIALGALMGHPAEAMVALSLAARVRETTVAVPGVIAWTLYEARRLAPSVKRS